MEVRPAATDVFDATSVHRPRRLILSSPHPNRSTVTVLVHAHPLLPHGGPLEEWEKVFLHFRYDPTVWSLYHLFVILAQPCIFSQTTLPSIYPSPLRRPLLVHQNTPIMGCLFYLSFRGIRYAFEGPLIPEYTQLNYVFAFKKFPSPLLSRRFAIFLTSFLSQLSIYNAGNLQRFLPSRLGSRALLTFTITFPLIV